MSDFFLFQVLDVSSVQLVYNNSHFKSLATGGNVSQALVCQKQKVKVSKLISLILVHVVQFIKTENESFSVR